MAERKRKNQTRNGQASREIRLAERLRPWWPSVGKAFAVLAVVAVLVGMQQWVQSPDTLPLRKVQIEGGFRYLDQAELERVVSPHAVGGFFGVDVAAIQEAAMALSWVEQVSVRRVWPDAVRIHVQEQVPVARWRDGELVNARGELFSAAGHEVTASLPALSGPRMRAGSLLKQYQQLSAAVQPLGVQINRLSQDVRRSLELELSNGVEVQLGRGEPQVRMQRFVRAYPGLLASRGEPLEAVDLRYSNGFAVRWAATNGVEES